MGHGTCRAVKVFSMVLTIADICHCTNAKAKPVEYTTARVSPRVDYGLQLITMSLSSVVINITTLIRDVNNKKGNWEVGMGSIWEISVLSP